jgi:ABC-2 type transport system ATP-binding protein
VSIRGLTARTLGLLVAATAVVPTTAAVAQDAGGGPSVTDHVITSFDGEPLEATLFVPEDATAEDPVPLVLRTHGWGGSRETSLGDGPDADPTSGPLARLVDEGYAVLTWDSRGFGCSGGIVRIDDPQVEGRDVTALIDWAVANVPVANDDGDPIVGMSGGSYAGGIQTAGASVDDRLDALAPEISWSDLRYSLFSGEVVNQGWVTLLYGLGTVAANTDGAAPTCRSGPNAGGLDPAIDEGVVEFVTSGTTRQGTLDFFAKSSLAAYGAATPVTAPTLVLQGSVDTLFDLTDGHGIYTHVRDQGVDARFVAFCGGHVACPASYADADDRRHLDDAIVTWFDRHLKGEDVDTGPPIEYRTNEGVWRAAETFPGPGDDALTASGTVEDLVVLPVVDIPDVPDTLTSLAAATAGGIPGLPTTTARASVEGDPRAATFPVARADGDVEVVGIPDATVTVTGTPVPLDDVLGPVGDLLGDLDVLEPVGDLLVGELGGPVAGIVAGLGGIDQLAGLADPRAHVFVKLVHRETGHVLNLQEGAVAVPLDGEPVTVDVPMPGLAYTLPGGDHLDVQLATGSLMHATGRVPARLDVELDVAVPASGRTRPLEPGVPEPDPAELDPAELDPAELDPVGTVLDEGPAPGGSDDTTGDTAPTVDDVTEDAVPAAAPAAAPVAAATTRPTGAMLPATGGGLGLAAAALLAANALRPRRDRVSRRGGARV